MALMTQRLLALCFGLPVNAGRADGISHSLRDQFTITIIVFCRQAAVKPIWAASLSGEMGSQNGLRGPSTARVSQRRTGVSADDAFKGILSAWKLRPRFMKIQGTFFL